MQRKLLVINGSIATEELVKILEQSLNVSGVERNEILAMLTELDISEDEIINLLSKQIFQIQSVPDFSKMMIDFRKLLYTPLPITRSNCFRKISSSKQTSLKSKRRLSCSKVHFNRRMMNSRR